MVEESKNVKIPIFRLNLKKIQRHVWDIQIEPESKAKEICEVIYEKDGNCQYEMNDLIFYISLDIIWCKRIRRRSNSELKS